MKRLHPVVNCVMPFEKMQGDGCVVIKYRVWNAIWYENSSINECSF
jgi:hypothetical protein